MNLEYRNSRSPLSFSRLSGAAAAGVLGIAIMAGANIATHRNDTLNAAPPPAGKADMRSLQDGFAQVAETVEPAVVSISAQRRV
ncbi:MAG: hypothetical protein WCL39_02485, partial [Armatimonadota bacterium]